MENVLTMVYNHVRRLNHGEDLVCEYGTAAGVGIRLSRAAEACDLLRTSECDLPHDGLGRVVERQKGVAHLFCRRRGRAGDLVRYPREAVAAYRYRLAGERWPRRRPHG